MKPQFITISIVKLKNNCPECFSNEGLELSFEQKFVESNFYKSISKETRHQIRCTNCNTQIFPVRWNGDIERVVNYHYKTFKPKAHSFKLKRKAWIIAISIVTVIITTSVLVINL